MKMLIDTHTIINGNKIFIEIENPSCKEDVEMRVKVFDQIMQNYFEKKVKEQKKSWLKSIVRTTDCLTEKVFDDGAIALAQEFCRRHRQRLGPCSVHSYEYHLLAELVGEENLKDD